MPGSLSITTIEQVIARVAVDPGPQQCPAGVVATGAAATGGLLSARGTFVLINPGPQQCPPGTALAVRQDAAGTARGFLAVLVPAAQLPAVQLSAIVPTGTPGESRLWPFPYGRPGRQGSGGGAE